MTTVDNLSLFGLNENEILIYRKVHAIGHATVLQLSKETGIKRTTVYRTIEKLKKKGFVYEFGVNESKRIATTPLSVLDEKIRKRELKILRMKNALAPVLRELTTSSQENSKISSNKTYTGSEGVKKVFEYLLNDISTEIITIHSQNHNIFPIFEFETAELFWNTCLTQKVKIKHHLSENIPLVWTNTEIINSKLYRELLHPNAPEILKNCTIIVRNNETIIIDWSNNIIQAQIIQNKGLSKLIEFYSNN
ncbi:MAG TPA: helix-turn-helix domain-containing protein [Flavobacterium alvei]|nr:helix-turn-helix domain-containing protein [Candidatus Dojkabacteria bacterium]HQF36104.1 helix-turn-helix domain-containing protein [Candidatus Dojkabacteria bacterium]HQK40490.1 helix-turn-helix domain-containing protein [Flavobacterium alvei]